MTLDALTASAEPERWVLVFQRETKSRWVMALARGRYKHVAAYAYLPRFKAWLIFDVNLVRTSILVVPDDEIGLGYLYDLTRGADLMAFARLAAPRGAPVCGWCVPAIKHLIGLRSSALRPDTLWRDCLAAGGKPLEHRPAEVCGTAA